MIRYLDEFRSSCATNEIVNRIRANSPARHIALMEVCGGHTHTIYKYGIAELLPEEIGLISGPGCPVCVTSQGFIDTAIELSRLDNVTIATFGDMIRVPGSVSSLLTERERGRDVRICLSAFDALTIAIDNPDRKIIFLGIGFETTAPSIGVTIRLALEKKLSNYSVLCGLKTMPEALSALAATKNIVLDGLICPGHVTAITGLSIYERLASEYAIPCVVSGFEPNDILRSIEMLVRQIASGVSRVENEYTRVVKPGGNPTALSILDDVFTPTTSEWRGLGSIPGSGLAIRDAYAAFDASKIFQVNLPGAHESIGCICGKVMAGLASPPDCGLFGKACTPESPVGACMVSSEGACGIRFQYRNIAPRRS